MPRRIRILIYEGPEEWLDMTLLSPNRAVIGDWFMTKPLVEFEKVPLRKISEAILPPPDKDFAQLNSTVQAAFDLIRGERSDSQLHPDQPYDWDEARLALESGQVDPGVESALDEEVAYMQDEKDAFADHLMRRY